MLDVKIAKQLEKGKIGRKLYQTFWTIQGYCIQSQIQTIENNGIFEEKQVQGSLLSKIWDRHP